MTRITVLGAGLNGMATALLLARDGHQVTVLERDHAEPEGGAERLWASWARPGVGHFRLPHFMLANWRHRMERELPEVIEEVERMGGVRLGTLDTLPAALTGGARAGDEDLRGIAARRPIVEGALAAVAARTRGVTVRRGARVTGLSAGSPSTNGAPHVTGVILDGGERVESDLVVDAMGRRTPIDAMLRAIGARSPRVREEGPSFVYYARHFRADRGGLTPFALRNHETVSLLSFPSDAGTFSLVLVTASDDRPLRELRDASTWERVLTLFPSVRELRASSVPVTGVQVMPGAGDRLRSLVADEGPVVTGLVAVGDSHARTTPSLGRGTSIGLAHACALRDTLREVAPDRAAELAHRFAEAGESVVGPLYRTAADYARHRMAEHQAERAGRRYRPDDRSWAVQRMLENLSRKDADVLRRYLRRMVLDLDTPAPADLPPAARAEVEALDGAVPAYLPGGPTRSELLAAIGTPAPETEEAP
jgi:2-polyprenyl-6-methoxyphenol hydroxylase-like FAD-dependent oxidoreductase